MDASEIGAVEEDGLAPDCQAAWSSTQLLLTDRLEAAEEARLRQHIERCGDCRDRYRGAVMTLARMGSERLRERTEVESSKRRARLRRAVVEYGRGPSGRSGTRWRVLVYSGLAIVLLLGSSRLQPPPATFTCDAGAAWIGEQELAPGEGRERLGRGEWFGTRPGGSARLSIGELGIELAGATTCGLERARPARLRLARGRLLVQGTCTVTTAAAVVQLAAAEGTIELDPLRIRCASGGITVATAAGEQRLQPGESWPEQPATD